MIIMVNIKFTRAEVHKVSIFLLTFFSYALFHANRKAFSNVKTSTGKVWTPSFHNATVQKLKPDKIWNSHHMFNDEDDAVNYQGALDTMFMVAYAVGLYLNGYIGDRVNMRILLTFGMASTSILVIIFGCVCEWLSFYNKYFYGTIWVLNGLMQSTGWPVVVSCMGNWFGHGSRGVLLGLWGSCASVGNILGALLVSSVLHYGYQYAFLLTASVLMSGALMIFFGLVPQPSDVGLEGPRDTDEATSPNETHSRGRSVNAEEIERAASKPQKPDIYVIGINGSTEVDKNSCEPQTVQTEDEKELQRKQSPAKIEPLLSDASEGNEIDFEHEERIHTTERQMEESLKPVLYSIESTRPASISFWRALLLPGVIPYALAYAFLKLVNYSFFFWLPFYLTNAFSWKEDVSDRLSTIYDIAGIVGGTLFGFASDFAGKRAVMIVPMLILSIPSLFFYSISPDDRLINSALMSVVGFFIGGAANIISAAVSADLGCQKALRGNDKALATVTGLIDGTGSVGAALGQVAVPHLQQSLGWHSVFYLFMICMFLTAVCLFPLFIQEIRSFRCWQNLSAWAHRTFSRFPDF